MTRKTSVEASTTTKTPKALKGMRALPLGFGPFGHGFLPKKRQTRVTRRPSVPRHPTLLSWPRKKGRSTTFVAESLQNPLQPREGDGEGRAAARGFAGVALCVCGRLRASKQASKQASERAGGGGLTVGERKERADG